jgi:hypothetical protein
VLCLVATWQCETEKDGPGDEANNDSEHSSGQESAQPLDLVRSKLGVEPRRSRSARLTSPGYKTHVDNITARRPRSAR